MSTEQDLVYPISVSLHLALNAFGKSIRPSSTLLSKVSLKLDRWCAPRVFKKLEACHSPVAIEYYKLIIQRTD